MTKSAFSCTAARRRNSIHHWLVGLLALAALMFAQFSVAHAQTGSGVICAPITATDAPQPGDIVTVTANLGTIGKVENSNIFYRILDPNGDPLPGYDHTTYLPELDNIPCSAPNVDTWSTSNNGFPLVGSYTVTYCWSPGNSQNCTIASGSTSFYSAPTLGLWLGLAALGMIGLIIWRNRTHFVSQERNT